MGIYILDNITKWAEGRGGTFLSVFIYPHSCLRVHLDKLIAPPQIQDTHAAHIQTTGTKGNLFH